MTSNIHTQILINAYTQHTIFKQFFFVINDHKLITKIMTLTINSNNFICINI
jgi:hypothetical protein